MTRREVLASSFALPVVLDALELVKVTERYEGHIFVRYEPRAIAEERRRLIREWEERSRRELCTVIETRFLMKVWGRSVDFEKVPSPALYSDLSALVLPLPYLAYLW